MSKPVVAGMHSSDWGQRAEVTTPPSSGMKSTWELLALWPCHGVTERPLSIGESHSQAICSDV